MFNSTALAENSLGAAANGRNVAANSGDLTLTQFDRCRFLLSDNPNFKAPATNFN
jgi:hypothetical protein